MKAWAKRYGAVFMVSFLLTDAWRSALLGGMGWVYVGGVAVILGAGTLLAYKMHLNPLNQKENNQ